MIRHLYHSSEQTGDHHVLSVWGSLRCHCGDHVLPFSYKLNSHDEFDHEGHLKEYHRKSEHYCAKDPDLRSHVMETFEVDGAFVHVTDCQIQIHGPMKWVLYVAWDEVLENVKVHRFFEQRYDHPEKCMGWDEVKKQIESKVRYSQVHHEKIKAHKAVLDGIVSQAKAAAASLPGKG